MGNMMKIWWNIVVGWNYWFLDVFGWEGWEWMWEYGWEWMGIYCFFLTVRAFRGKGGDSNERKNLRNYNHLLVQMKHRDFTMTIWETSRLYSSISSTVYSLYQNRGYANKWQVSYYRKWGFNPWDFVMAFFLVGLDRFLGCLFLFVLGQLLYVKWLSCCHKSQVISPQLMEPQTEQIQNQALNWGLFLTRSRELVASHQ